MSPRSAQDRFEVTILPGTLSLIAGIVDVTSFVLLKGLFSAHITGNLVVLMADLALRRPLSGLRVLSVPLFVVVAATISVLVNRFRLDSWSWARVLLAVQAVLLGATTVVAVTTRSGGGTVAAASIAILAIMAMAAQNALLHLSFDRAPSTSVMTGNVVLASITLVGLLMSPGQRKRDQQAWRSTWPVLVGFLLGVVSGALAAGALLWWAWALSASIATSLAIISYFQPRPSTARSF